MLDKIARAFRRAGLPLPWGHMANITKAEREARKAKPVAVVALTDKGPVITVAHEPDEAALCASFSDSGPNCLMHRDGIEAEVRKGPSVEIMLAQGWELRG